MYYNFAGCIADAARHPLMDAGVGLLAYTKAAHRKELLASSRAAAGARVKAGHVE